MVSRILSLSFVVPIFALLASGSLCAQPVRADIGRHQTACCTSNSGQTVCGNITPSQCAGREIKVYNREGLYIRTIPALMTDIEKKIADKAEKERQAKEAAIREQIRRDAAIRQTYSSLAEIDRMQKNAEMPVNLEIKDILIKLAAAGKKKQELDQEASFYDNQAIPPELAKSIHDEAMELKTLNEILTAKSNDLKQIRDRYESDRARYKELTAGEQGKP